MKCVKINNLYKSLIILVCKCEMFLFSGNDETVTACESHHNEVNQDVALGNLLDMMTFTSPSAVSTLCLALISRFIILTC